MCMKCSGRKVRAVDSSGLGSSPGWGHYLVFLGSMTITVPLSTQVYGRRRGGLVVSVFVPGSSGPGSCPGRRHCVVFLGKTLNSHSASLHTGV